MAITNKQLVQDFSFKPSPDNRRVLVRRVHNYTLNAHKNYLWYRGVLVHHLENLSLVEFERWINSFIKREVDKQNEESKVC